MLLKPHFLFLYAPGQTVLLPFIGQEYNSLREIFQRNLLWLKFLPVGYTDLDVIHNLFNYGHGRILWLHFSGHSTGSTIELIDKAVDTPNLATLLRMEGKLALAFINGCQSAGQVDELLSAGVKIVIATSGPVGDQKASFFSTRFYKAFLSGKSIAEAFLTARNQLCLEFNIQQDDPFFRGLGHPTPLKKDLWGLYGKEDDEWYLDLTLWQLLGQYYLKMLYSFKKIFMSVAMAIAMIVMACGVQTHVKSKNYNHLIIGKWQQTNDSSHILEFNEKGSAVESNDYGNGKWRINENKELIIVWDDNGTVVYPIKELDYDQLNFEKISFIKID